MNTADRALPIKTVYSGVSCANCMTTRDDLLTCGSCRRARYCDRSCQRKDWKQLHKHECQILRLFQENYNDLGDTLLQKIAAMKLLVQHLIEEGAMPAAALEYWDRHRRFIQYARVCSVCRRNEYELGAEAQWVNCSTCKFGWCCSQNHFDQYQSQHTQEVCDAYVNSIAVSRFHWNHVEQYNETFISPPDTNRTEIMETFPSNWNEYFQIRHPVAYQASQQHQLPAEFLPAATYELSQPSTCLFAMYMHGIDEFKDKSTLTIHVVGASFTYEIVPSCVWEEILHCLPNVQRLLIVFIGPDAWKADATETCEENDAGCCPTCTSRNRTRSISIYGLTYHDYKASSKFTAPDLVVAFNTGMYEEYTESWKTSLEEILDMDVPALFTSFNKDEADQDHAVLVSLNANVLPGSPALNPMRVAHAEIEAGGEAIDAFFHHNMYYSGFKGRV